jgi:hypothetical protein
MQAGSMHSAYRPESTMIRTAAALLLAALSCPTLADRITELNRTERCVYTAKLHVAGYYYYPAVRQAILGAQCGQASAEEKAPSPVVGED